nr:TniB family NTP-binding protein [Sinorhizobium meliloti]
MTSRPGERRFYAELLTLLGAPQRPRADIAQMEQAALRIMEAIGVQVLVIDEVHNILAGGLSGILCGGPVSSVEEPLAKDDGELCLCLDPFPRRPFPLLGRVVKNEI